MIDTLYTGGWWVPGLCEGCLCVQPLGCADDGHVPLPLCLGLLSSRLSALSGIIVTHTSCQLGQVVVLAMTTNERMNAGRYRHFQSGQQIH